MSIATKCSHCGAAYNLNDGMAGKKVRCKSCQEIFVVPNAGAPKPPAKAGNGSQKVQPASRPVKSAASTPPPPTKGDDPGAKPAKKAAAKKKSSTGKVLLIVGGISAALLLVCCVVPTVLSFVGVFSFTSKVNNEVKTPEEARAEIEKAMQKALEEQTKGMGNGPGNPGPGNAGPGNPPVKIEFPGGFGQKDPESVADALKDLRGTDNVRQDVACRWLAKQPVDPAQQAEVAKALGSLLADRKNTSALTALKTWATKDNVPAIADYLDSNVRTPFFPGGNQDIAMQTLARLPDERGAESVARYLPIFGFSSEPTVKALETMGPVAEKAVLRYFNDQDGGGRDRARKLIQGYGTKDVAIALQCAADLHSSKLDTRKLAADWLAQATVDPQIQPQVAKELEANLKDSDWGARARTVHALGVWGTADNVPGLAALVEDSAPQFGEARLEGIIALGKLKDERGVPALIACLDKNWERQRAGQALVAIGPPAEKGLLKYVADPASNRDGVMEAQQVLKKMGSKENVGVTVALKDLKDSNAGRRHDAARSLAEMPSPDRGVQADVAKALAETLEDPDHGTAEEAARALIVWATPDVVPALLKGIDSKNGWIRHRSMEALGKMKEESAARPIAAHLVPGEDREAASKALQLMVGTKAEDEVRPYLLHTDEGVVIEACRVLQAIGTKSNRKTMAALDQMVKAAALRKNVAIYNAALAAGQAIGRR